MLLLSDVLLRERELAYTRYRLRDSPRKRERECIVRWRCCCCRYIRRCGYTPCASRRACAREIELRDAVVQLLCLVWKRAALCPFYTCARILEHVVQLKFEETIVDSYNVCCVILKKRKVADRYKRGYCESVKDYLWSYRIMFHSESCMSHCRIVWDCAYAYVKTGLALHDQSMSS